MADACTGLDHRYGGVLHDVLNQGSAAARDDDVEQTVQLQHFIHRRAVRVFDELQRFDRIGGIGQGRCATTSTILHVGIQGGGTAAQQRGIADFRQRPAASTVTLGRAS